MKWLFALMFCLPQLAMAHARMKVPIPRVNNDGIKGPAPCGNFAKPAAANVSNVYRQGQVLQLQFEETIDHPGKYLFFLSQGSDQNFPVTPILVVPDIQGAGLPRQYTASLQLPTNYACENCTLQMIQSMEENPNAPSFYYSCADIQVLANAQPPSPPSPGGQTDLGSNSPTAVEKPGFGCGLVSGAHSISRIDKNGGPPMSRAIGLIALLLLPLFAYLRLRLQPRRLSIRA